MEARQLCRSLTAERLASLQHVVVDAQRSRIQTLLQQRHGQQDAFRRLNNILRTHFRNWQQLLSEAAAQGAPALGAPGALLLRAEVIAQAARDAEAEARRLTEQSFFHLARAAPGGGAAFRTACLAATACVNRWHSLQEIATEAQAAAQAAEDALGEARSKAEDMAAQLLAAV